MPDGLVPLVHQVLSTASLPCGCEASLILERGIAVSDAARVVGGKALGYFPCDEHGRGLVNAVMGRYAEHVGDDRFVGLGMAETLAAVVQEVIDGGEASR